MHSTHNDLDAQDRRFMSAALRLARKHQGLTQTNPSVACVIVADFPHGRCIVGSGVTAIGGRPHAEPPALEEAGEFARGATAYVTLEPCAHHGKTPPCAQTLIDAGVSRVVTAITDPDGRVNGQGHQMLLDAEITVSEMDGGEDAHRVMQGYLKARSQSQPFITLKMAMTEQGLIGSSEMGNLKISGSVSHGVTHLVRARHDAILIGGNTAKLDDPSLTCRLPGLSQRSPVRIVLDAKSRLNEDNSLVATAAQFPTIVVAPPDAPQDWRAMMIRNGVQLLACETVNGRIALPELFDDLGARGIQSIMVEAGSTLASSLLDEGLVDEIILHIGDNAQLLKDPETGVYADFTPDNPPSGFDICQELKFGADRSLRLRKTQG